MNGASDGSLPMQTEVVVSADDTTIAYRSVGKGPAGIFCTFVVYGTCTGAMCRTRHAAAHSGENRL